MAATHYAVKTQGNERGGNRDLYVIQRQHYLNESGKKKYARNGDGMSDCDGDQRFDNRPDAFLLHAEGDGEEPAHARIDAVKRTQSKESRPAPAGHE
jgi:hypothetical protein